MTSCEGFSLSFQFLKFHWVYGLRALLHCITGGSNKGFEKYYFRFFGSRQRINNLINSTERLAVHLNIQ